MTQRRITYVARSQRMRVLCPQCWPVFVYDCTLCGGTGELAVRDIQVSRKYL